MGSYFNPETHFNARIKINNLATGGQRIFNFFLDRIFAETFHYIIVFSLKGLEMIELSERIYHPLYAYPIIFMYYFFLEAICGRTIGKFITGTKAVNEDGSKLTIGRAFGRTACRLIPFEALSFLFGEGRPKGWHDRIPKTKVITLRTEL